MFNIKQEMYQKKIELFDSVFDFSNFWQIADMIPASANEYLLWVATISLGSVIAFKALRVVARSFRNTAA